MVMPLISRESEEAIKDTYPTLYFCEECKRRSSTDRVVCYDEVDDSLR